MVFNGLSLVQDPGGNVIMHIVDETHTFNAPDTPASVIAVDLMESLNSRQRLARLIELFVTPR